MADKSTPITRLKCICFTLFFCVGSFVFSAPEHLLPLPKTVQRTASAFTLKQVRLDTPVWQEEWQAFVCEQGGTLSEQADAHIRVELVDRIPEAGDKQQEAYRISIGAKGIAVQAVTQQGVYWAIQTLRQWGTPHKGHTRFAGGDITDWPSFAIRGFMQDAGRSYISPDELKREVDRLSRFKINVFHWHLTENQAWRLESRIFPMLNDSVNMTRMPGKFYTLEQAREMVDYCRRHNMLLIPEIDMPGHSAAFERVFRHSMQSAEGMKILKLLLDEVCETFDVPYLHIGTDEVQFTNPSFVPEMVAYVRAKGKKVISWNPGWNYKPGEIDMTQLWSFRGKAQPGIPAIDSKFHYANHFDTFADIVPLYQSTICGQTEGSADVAGSIVAFWHDRLLPDERAMVLENGFYPHVLAIAERTWMGGGTEYYDGDGTNLQTASADKFNAFADFERRLLWHKDHTLRGCPIGYVRQTDVHWHITDAFPNGGDLSMSFPPEKELSTTYSYKGKTYGVRPATGAGIYLRHVWGGLGKNSIPTFYKEPEENHTAYAYTWVYSPKTQQVGLLAETQNYSRSEMDLPPRQGTWDYRGSRLLINDKPVEPPVWTASHTVKSNETPLGNENCVGREPIPVTLHKGWNKVLWKLPVGSFQTPEVRLVKWMFTTVFVTMDGSKAVDGLVYSPEKKIHR